MGTYVSIYVTCAGRDEAKAIAHALVSEGLAACANILPEVQSIYRWQGQVEEAVECAFIAKTRQALAERATARIKEMHSYDVPCIVVWTIAAGYPPYLDWIEGETLSG